jgi:hypothetical protein
MPYALAATEHELLAGMADGRMLRRRRPGETWDETGVHVGSITAMAVPE